MGRRFRARGAPGPQVQVRVRRTRPRPSRVREGSASAVLALDAARADGGWDAIVTWALWTPGAGGPRRRRPCGSRGARGGGASRLRRERPASRIPRRRPRRGPRTRSQRDRDVDGARPPSVGSSASRGRFGIFPTAGGGAAYEPRQAEALVVGMEVRLPSAADAPPNGVRGPGADVRVGEPHGRGAVSLRTSAATRTTGSSSRRARAGR